MFCTRCGVKLEESDRYCSSCGTATPNAPQVPVGAPRRLMRSAYDKKIAGVCGGIAEYLSVDSTLIRLIFLVLFFTPPGIGLIAYIIGWIVIPKSPLRIGPMYGAAQQPL
jgi:phage shock protein C